MADEYEIESVVLERMANKARFSEGPVAEEQVIPDTDSIEFASPVRERRPVLVEECESESPKVQRSPIQNITTTDHEPDSFTLKKECLIEIRQLRTRGAWFARQYTFEDSVAEMRQALEMARIELVDKTNQCRNTAGVKTARRVLLAGVSMLEFLHTKWNPLNLHLNGFGEYVMGNIDDYDNVFQRLIEKYQGSGQMAPELELIVMLGTSAIMFHVSNMFVSRAMSQAPRDEKTEVVNDADRFE
jgi:hypothetical protein